MPMMTMKDRLALDGLISKVILGDEAQTLLRSMQLTDAPLTGDPDAATGEKGSVLFTENEKFLGFFDLNLTPPLTAVPYKLSYTSEGGVRTGFRVAVALSLIPPAKKLFEFAANAGGAGFVGADKHVEGEDEFLVSNGGKVALTGAEVALVVKGKAGREATVTLSPTIEGPDGMVKLGLLPATVMIAGTDFGLEFPEEGVVIDDTEEAAPPERAKIDGVEIATPADTPAWRGIAVSTLRFHLPKDLPFFGKHPVGAYLEVGKDPTPGIDLIVTAKLPPKNGRPGIAVRIECRDPAATGLSSFVPTLVEAAMELPLDGRQEHFPQGGASRSITFAAGKPVIVRARFSRAPKSAAPEMALSLAIEAQGADGILAVKTEGGGVGEKAIVAAGALITALIADKNIGDPGPGGDASGVFLHVLLTAAAGLSSFLEGGKVVLHGVELASEGTKMPVGGLLQMKLDYSVDVVVDTFDVGVLSIGMRPSQPMKVRIREVLLTVDSSKSGLEMIHLGVDEAKMEIEDPGGWNVKSPGSLFDILGTRSGRGSTWIEIDLRFKLDLGPIKVSGATIRATIADDGGIDASLRGLEASLNLAPAIEASGAFQLLPPAAPGRPPGFDAMLAAKILPLNLAAQATLLLEDEMIKLSLGVDLPGPIPLASTGLGIFGLGGVFAINGRSKPFELGVDPETDVVTYELAWDYTKGRFFKADPGAFLFGFEAVLGTAPDLGFTFSARAGLFLTVPEIQVRGMLLGKVLSPRVTIVRDANGERKDEGAVAVGISAKGVVVIDGTDGVTIGIEGALDIPILLQFRVPIGMRFPFRDADWYIYLGADGYEKQGRAMGPIRAVVLPDILAQDADAYLMFRGNGIAQFPRGGEIQVDKGFVLAFGFGFQFVLGVKPVVWAEVHARADIFIATHPLMLAGFGNVGGSLNLGPFSIGIDADLKFFLAEHRDPWLFARICAHIDLFFFEVEGCVEISIHTDEAKSVPKPTEHPLDRIEAPAGGAPRPAPGGSLVDDRYTKLADLSETPDAAPVVWPDTIPLLAFSIAPTLVPGSAPQFTGVDNYPEGKRAKPLGNDLLEYIWQLDGLELSDVTDDPAGEGTPVPSPMLATWVDGKYGEAGGQPQPAELALFRLDGTFWVDKLADGGASVPDDPIGDTASICQGIASAGIGWAIGSAAAGWQAFHLPSDPISPDPLQSQVRATAVLGCDRLEGALNSYSAQRLPLPLRFVAPRRVAFAAPTPLHDRGFNGYLDCGHAEGPPGFAQNPAVIEFLHALRIPLDEPVTEARAWFAIDPEPPGVQSRITVRDDRGQVWLRNDQAPLPDGTLGVRYEPPAPGPVASLLVTWPLQLRLGILGVGGVTLTAQAAADARNRARQEKAAALADAAQKGPLKNDDPSAATARTVLQAGRLYRLKVSLSWTGTLYERKDGVKSPSANSPPKNTVYAPPTGDTTTIRSFFFRTTPVLPALAPGNPSVVPDFGDKKRFQVIFRARDLFDPAMLERHLLGYEPAQSEATRFRNDPLRTHYAVPHVAVLADRYEYKLTTGYRRTDVAGNDGNEIELAGKWTALSAVQYARGADMRRIEVYEKSVCKIPLPGATYAGGSCWVPGW